MHSFFRRFVPVSGALALTFALVAPLAGAAQDDPNADSVAADGTGVARISLIDGDVAVQRGDSSDSLSAVRNAPVLGGDYVTSGDASRAEIQIDGYAQIRLDQDTQMRFTHLDPGNRSIQLAAGTLNLRLTHGADGSSEIDTPSIGIQPQRSGNYRVTVTPDGATLVTVRSGDATIVTPQGRQDLPPGSTVAASGDPANPAIRIAAAIAADDFDRFNSDRDRMLAAARRRRGVRQSPNRRPRRAGGRRPLGHGRVVRHCLGTGRGRTRLGAVSRRPLGLGRRLRLDVAGRRAVGLGAVSLRQLV